jgi:hypothetical protein
MIQLVLKYLEDLGFILSLDLITKYVHIKSTTV